MGISHLHNDPNRFPNILATELHIGPELGIINNAIRAPAGPHSCGFKIIYFAIVITPVIQVVGIDCCHTVGAKSYNGMCITYRDRWDIISVATVGVG
jgi:hypothetical protein